MEMFVPATPQILLRKFLEPNKELSMTMGVWGEYEVIKRSWDAVQKRFDVTQHLLFKDNKNVITDIGLQKLASGNAGIGSALASALNFLHFGTGTTTPVSTDTSLAGWGVNAATSYSSGLSSQGSAPDFYAQLQWDLGLATANGTWTEVGIGWSNASSGNIFSRNLFKDGNGNPTSVQKVANVDTLTVIYRLHFVRSSDTPVESTISVTGGSGSVTAQVLMTNAGLSQLASYNGYVPFITSLPSAQWCKIGTNTGVITPTLTGVRSSIGDANLVNFTNYVTNTMYRDVTIEWPANIVGTIYEAGGVIIYGSSTQCALFRFVEGIPKDNTKKFRLNFRGNYGRAA